MTPIKNEIEGFVDRLFKEAPDPFRYLNGFDQQVRAVVDVMDVEYLLRRLLTESLRAVSGCGGAVCLAKDGDLHLVHMTPGWQGTPVLQLAINHEETAVGWLLLGARRDGSGYSEAERGRLQQSLDKVGHALVLLLAEQRTIHTQPIPSHLTITWPPACAAEDESGHKSQTQTDVHPTVQAAVPTAIGRAA